MDAFTLPRFQDWKPEDWSALGTMLTTIIAIVAAFVAYHQVREARRTREAQSQPFVVVDIQPSRVRMNILNLIVENVGATLARNVEIKFEPPLLSSHNDLRISDSTLLMEGIPTLPPRRRIEIFFDVSHERMATTLPMRYDVHVSFADAFGRKQEALQYIIDLKHLTGLTYIQEYGVHDIATAAREIEKHMKGWSRPGSSLRV